MFIITGDFVSDLWTFCRLKHPFWGSNLQKGTAILYMSGIYRYLVRDLCTLTFCLRQAPDFPSWTCKKVKKLFVEGSSMAVGGLLIGEFR